MDQMYRGLVRDKVLDYIMYNGGESRHYISLVSLQSLLAQICEIDECPKYIRITPFYKHSTRSIGIELDDRHPSKLQKVNLVLSPRGSVG